MTSVVEIIESVGTGAVRFLVDKSCNLEPGSIVELTEIDKNPCVTLSDGSKPFGIVTETNGPYGMATVHFDTMILRSEKFDKECVYKPGDLVYSSIWGLLTTKKPHENAHLIGHVVSEPNVERAFVEINWI